jgi:hypothetical protein
MSTGTLRLLIAGVFLVHGIGHTMGALPLFGLGTEKWHLDSKLLTPLLGKTVSHVVGAAIFLVAAVGFIAVAAGVMGWIFSPPLWRWLATLLAILSLVGLALYWHGFASLFNKVGALGVNVATLGALLALQWPPESVA